MKLTDYLKTHDGMTVENHYSRVIILLLVVAVVVLIFMQMNTKPILSVQPFTLTEEAWVSSSDGSRNYKESWAWAVAQMTGNVRPETVDFVKSRLGPLLDSSIYSQAITALEIQAENIRSNRVAMRFEPEVVRYEKSTNKTFVFGQSFMEGFSGNETRTSRTYEYIINIKNYAPRISGINTYEGKPRTKEVLAEMERHKQRRNQD